MDERIRYNREFIEGFRRLKVLYNLKKNVQRSYDRLMYGLFSPVCQIKTVFIVCLFVCLFVVYL